MTPLSPRPLTLCVFAVALLVGMTEVSAWGCVGHMLVAEIARRHLDDTNAEKIEAMAMRFEASGPFPGSPDMVQGACWPDDVKGWHQYAMSSWHFIDQPYNPDNISIEAPPDPINAVSVSLDMVTSLRHSKSPIYVLNFAWVYLVHLIGDLHQPLHAATLYSKTYPHGDRGGNAIEVHVHGKIMKLHALWDDICAATAPTYHRPLSDTDSFALAATADRLEDTYKFPTSMRTLEDVQTIADESFAFAVNSSYPGASAGTTLTDEYLERCTEVAEGRLTLGGYRLGHILNKLLTNITVDDETLATYRTRKEARRSRKKKSRVILRRLR